MKSVLKTKSLEDELLKLQEKIEDELFRIKQFGHLKEFDVKFFKGREE